MRGEGEGYGQSFLGLRRSTGGALQPPLGGTEGLWRKGGGARRACSCCSGKSISPGRQGQGFPLIQPRAVLCWEWRVGPPSAGPGGETREVGERGEGERAGGARHQRCAPGNAGGGFNLNEAMGQEDPSHEAPQSSPRTHVPPNRSPLLGSWAQARLAVRQGASAQGINQGKPPAPCLAPGAGPWCTRDCWTCVRWEATGPWGRRRCSAPWAAPSSSGAPSGIPTGAHSNAAASSGAASGANGAPRGGPLQNSEQLRPGALGTSLGSCSGVWSGAEAHCSKGREEHTEPPAPAGGPAAAAGLPGTEPGLAQLSCNPGEHLCRGWPVARSACARSAGARSAAAGPGWGQAVSPSAKSALGVPEGPEPPGCPPPPSLAHTAHAGRGPGAYPLSHRSLSQEPHKR